MSQHVSDSRPSCVIADDLRLSRELLRAWITDCGYDCTTTTNGHQAWTAIKDLHPRLVVTDIEMPVASGLDLLHSLRQHELSILNSLPVIVVSSLQDDDIRAFVHEAGATFLLTKPLDKQLTQQAVQGIDHLSRVASERKSMTSTYSRVDEVHKVSTRISPTLRRLYGEIQRSGPKFK